MRYCLLLLLAISIFASCETVEPLKTNADYLRDKGWWMDTIIYTYHVPFSARDSVWGAAKPECLMDDRVVFVEGTKGTHNTSDQKCGPELDQYEFAWGLTENDTKMYLYNVKSFLGIENVNAMVKEINPETFTIVFPNYNYVQVDTGFIRDTTDIMITFVPR